MTDLSKHKLELDYPCDWEYKVVIRKENEIKDIIKDVIDQREHNITPSKQSSQGKFTSHTLKMEVNDEKDRQDIYKQLGEHKDIKMVI